MRRMLKNRGNNALAHQISAQRTMHGLVIHMISFLAYFPRVPNEPLVVRDE